MADQITDEMVEAAERAYMSAQTDLPYHECERCGGSGAVGESRCPDCGGGGIIVEFPEGWNPMRAALEAAARVAPEPVAKDWLDDFDGDKPIYTDRELIDLLGTLLQAQVREQRINSIEELHGMLRHIGRSQRAHRAHRALTGADSNA